MLNETIVLHMTFSGKNIALIKTLTSLSLVHSRDSMMTDYEKNAQKVTSQRHYVVLVVVCSSE